MPVGGAQLPAQGGGHQAGGPAHRAPGRRVLQPRARGRLQAVLRQSRHAQPALRRVGRLRRGPARPRALPGPGRPADHLQGLRPVGHGQGPRPGELRGGGAQPRLLRAHQGRLRAGLHRPDRAGQEDGRHPARPHDAQALPHGQRVLQGARLQRAALQRVRRADRACLPGRGAGRDVLPLQAAPRPYGGAGGGRGRLHLHAAHPHRPAREVHRRAQLRLPVHAGGGRARRPGARLQGTRHRAHQPTVRDGLRPERHRRLAARDRRAPGLHPAAGGPRHAQGRLRGDEVHQGARGLRRRAAALAQARRAGHRARDAQLQLRGPHPQLRHRARPYRARLQGAHGEPPARPLARHLHGLPEPLLALRPARHLGRQARAARPAPLRRVSHQPRLRPRRHGEPPLPQGDGRQALPADRDG